MDSDFTERTKSESSSLPQSVGEFYDDPRRNYKYESRPRLKEYDRERDRSRHERGRESRFDREEYSRSYSGERRVYAEDKDYRETKESSSEISRSRTKDSTRDYRYEGKSSNKDSDRESRYDRKSYRDRSRDRSRERDKDRKDRTRERDRSWTDNEVDCRDDIPNNTVIVKGLPPHVTEEDIRNEINKYTLYPTDIILKRKKITAESRGFAFVEFRLLSDAVRWKELTQGFLYFGPARATIHYAVPRDGPDRRMDWKCLKCGVHNFRKRDYCFKCGGPREDSDTSSLGGGEGCEEIGNCPSCTLLFRNLDILTTEERVLSMLGQITVLPIKNLKVAKDSLTSTSRGFAYVELHSISEAMQLHDLLVCMEGNFYVDGRRVTVSYSRRPLSLLNSAASATAASAALAAAQWTNQDASYNQSQKMFSDSTFRERHMESVQSLNAGVGNNFEKKGTPDVSTYQYDETSGYYYDSTTGYYYDANSQYYYNSVSQQYLYWDLEKQAYTVVPTANNGVTSASAVISSPATKVNPTADVVISSPPVIAHAPVLNKKEEEKPKEKINPQDKVKIAKKVAKDMEKWARTLNQKKENSKMVHNFTNKSADEHLSKTTESSSGSSSKTDLQLMETLKKVEMVLADGELLFAGIDKDTGGGLVAEYCGESDPEADTEYQDEGTKAIELLKSEEAKLIDWVKLTCLLCKRQFPSKDVLTKHIQMSDLHKQNVNMLKLTKLTPRQLQELEKKESGYRDRAKERREKFGQPDLPPPSRLKTKYMKERKEAYLPPEQPAEAIGSDNIGNKMLKAMGWSEGQGLGKSGQGMSGIIEVQRRVKSAGLGMKGAQYGANARDSYKDAVRKSMQARYNEVT